MESSDDPNKASKTRSSVSKKPILTKKNNCDESAKPPKIGVISSDNDV